MQNPSDFGSLFKSLRQKTGLTLRGFCSKYQLDPGNISRMERGLLSPPASREKLSTYASYLGLVEGSDDWHSFFDFAASSAGRIPSSIMDDKQLLSKLPVVFRTLRGQKDTPEQAAALAELIRRS